MAPSTKEPTVPPGEDSSATLQELGRAGLLHRLDQATREVLRLRDEVRRLEAERCRDLEQQLEAATFERDGYYGEWQHARNQLDEIHQSRVWRLWVWSCRVRRWLAVPFGTVRILTLTLRRAARGAGWLGSLAWHAIRAIPRLLGAIYLELEVAVRRIGAAVRTGRAPRGGESSEHSGEHAHERRPRVLIAMPYQIHPPNHGGGVRLANLIRNLARTCHVHVLVYSQRGEDPAQRAALERVVDRVDFHHWRPRQQPDMWGLSPPNAQLFDSDLARAKLRDIVFDHGIDIVQLEYTELGQLASAAPDGVPVILTEHDIAFRQHQRRHALRFGDRFPESRNFGSSRRDLLRLLRYELRSCAAADQVHTMSEEDGRFLSRYLPRLPSRTWVVPNGVDTEHYDPGSSSAARADVLYVGNYQNLPNVDALEYLVEDIWPLIRLRCPTARLSVVGSNVDERVRRFHGRDGISVVGAVPDLRASYHSHRVMVAPIRAGSGTRLKILEAFAAGIPVVSSALGAEGIECVDGDHCLIRDQPATFADAVARLLEDGALCSSLSRSARELVVERYDWRPVSRTLLSAYHSLLENDGRVGSGEVAVAPFLAPDGAASGRSADVSVVIPTLNGGSALSSCLRAIRAQRTDLRVEIVCVDSGSSPGDLEAMRGQGALVHTVDQRQFNHGLTRDLGARIASAPLLVFLNQDAVPVGDDWIDRLLEPLLFDRTGRVVAVQGGIREVGDRLARFYWDSCGARFYFTRESQQWLARYGGLGFSTVHCAIRRSAWERYPFGWAPTMEDKKWQREIHDAGLEIAARHDVCVEHTHNYALRGLLRRCASEGYGWHLLGESYTLRDMLADMTNPSVWRDRAAGVKDGGIRTGSEKWFPILRPAAVWWGNRVSRRMRH